MKGCWQVLIAEKDCSKQAFSRSEVSLLSAVFVFASKPIQLGVITFISQPIVLFFVHCEFRFSLLKHVSAQMNVPVMCLYKNTLSVTPN